MWTIVKLIAGSLCGLCVLVSLGFFIADKIWYKKHPVEKFEE